MIKYEKKMTQKFKKIIWFSNFISEEFERSNKETNGSAVQINMGGKGTFDDPFSHIDLEDLEVGFYEASPCLTVSLNFHWGW